MYKQFFSTLLFIALCCNNIATCHSENLTPSGIQLALNPPPSIDSLSRNESRSIFSMRVRVWPDGSPITVFVMPDDNPLHSIFVRQLLALLPHQLRRNWNRMVYTGIGQAPIEVANEAEMLLRLKDTPGSIGYLRQGTKNDQLRQITLR